MRSLAALCLVSLLSTSVLAEEAPPAENAPPKENPPPTVKEETPPPEKKEPAMSEFLTHDGFRVHLLLGSGPQVKGVNLEQGGSLLGLGYFIGTRFDINTGLTFNLGVELHPLAWVNREIFKWIDPYARVGFLAGVGPMLIGAPFTGMGLDVRVAPWSWIPHLSFAYQFPLAFPAELQRGELMAGV